MRNRWCLILALFVCLTGCSNKCETYTVVISMDAFRWDYPEPKFRFPKPVFAHFCGMNRAMNHLRIEDAACVVLIYTEHTNGFDMIVRDLEDAKKQGKPIFPIWMSDVPISTELEALVDTENYQIKATCFTKKELIAQLGAYELMKCIFQF